MGKGELVFTTQWSPDCGGDQNLTGQFGLKIFGVAYPNGSYGVSLYIGEEDEVVEVRGKRPTQAEAQGEMEKWAREVGEKIRTGLVILLHELREESPDA